MTTSASILAALADDALRQRFVAMAIAQRIPNPEQFVALNYPALLMAPVQESDDSTVVSVYEYAVAQYAPKPKPGADPSAVTDAHITHAISSLLTPPVDPTEPGDETVPEVTV